MLAQIYALQGDREKTESIINEEFINSVRRDIQYPWHIAVARTMLGDYDEALDWLETPIGNFYANHRFLAEFDPYLEPLRKEQRFIDLVEHIRSEAD